MDEATGWTIVADTSGDTPLGSALHSCLYYMREHARGLKQAQQSH
jgi:hypothetical protein